ncbi:hypothetical protein JCM30760_26050 [Thiomicrorhabdus hydrogeniphila]
MLKKISNFFQKNRDFVNKSKEIKRDKEILEELQDIPRYPPFIKGLPFASVELLLQTQKEILSEIRLEAGISVYEQIYLSCIKEYCSFVHLLPASEKNHHRGAGGLFRHGLEVGLMALKYSKYKLFDTHLYPSERIENKEKWVLAAFLSGLTHDIGKPLSDYQVVSKDGRHIWNPFTQTITQWGKEHALTDYYLHWQEDRYRKHESLSSVVSKRIISDEALSFMSTTGNVIIRNMFEVVTNQAAYDNKLYELVKKADHDSSERDNKTANLRGEDVNLSIPLEKYLIDAIKLSNIKNDWGDAFISNPPLLFIDENLYITAKGMKRLTEKLAESKVPGIPWDQKALTETLINKGFADNRETTDGDISNMWPIQDKVNNKLIWGVKIKDWAVIFPDKPTLDINHKILTDIELDNLQTKNKDNQKSQTSNNDNVSHRKQEAPHAENAPVIENNHPAPDNVSHRKQEAVHAENTPATEDNHPAPDNVSHRKQEAVHAENAPATEDNHPAPDNVSHRKQEAVHAENTPATEDNHPAPDNVSHRKQEAVVSESTADNKSVKEKNDELEKEATQIELTRKEVVKVKISDLVTSIDKSAWYINKQGQLLLNVKQIGDEFKTNDYLTAIEESLVVNSTGSKTHLINNIPVLIIDNSYHDLKAPKKQPPPSKKPTRQKKKMADNDLNQHRDVPEDFDPNNTHPVKTNPKKPDVSKKDSKSTLCIDKPSQQGLTIKDNNNQRILIANLKSFCDYRTLPTFKKFENGEIDLIELSNEMKIQYANDNFKLDMINRVMKELNG